MEKLYALIIITSIFFTSASGVSANSNHGLSVDKVVQEIMLSQNISDADDISCESITENQFEEMGEAAMTLRHPDEREHEFMDQMMGGEGSESLKSAHVRMGRGYLGCLDEVEGMAGGMMGSTGMMASRRQGSDGQGGGENMMGNFGMMGSQMMGESAYTGALGSLWAVTWILIVILLVVMIRYFWNKGNAKK